MSTIIYTQFSYKQSKNIEFALFDLAPLLRNIYKGLNNQTRFSVTLHTICKSRSGAKFPKTFQSSIHYPRCEQKFCSCIFSIFASFCHEVKFQSDYSRFYNLVSVDFNIEPRI